MYIFIPVVLILAATIILVVRNLVQRKIPLCCEYWIYMRESTIPESSEVMDQMMRASPWPHAITKREGMILSDIRLNVALVLRSKNPQLFRPDLFDSPAIVSADHLSELANCAAFLKVEYTSPSPLPDDRHLTAIPHMARAYAELTSSNLLLDTATGTLYTKEEFVSYISAHTSLETYDAQIQVQYAVSEGGMGSARATGFGKIGLPDLISMPAPNDQRYLLQEITELVGRKLWKDRALESIVMIRNDLDEFMVQILPRNRSSRTIRVHRIVTND